MQHSTVSDPSCGTGTMAIASLTLLVVLMESPIHPTFKPVHSNGEQEQCLGCP
ncbi:MAG: hypothetical protein V7L29_28840 [Nostoc sp.]|uniref:hypothetical protein n=1 Tax=Nostoc sp. TaxID=1180 RepID=UPI002FFC3C28